MTSKAAALDDDSSIAGQCLCGRVKFRVTGKPVAVNCCHCRDCQRTTGSAFAVNALYPAERVEITSGPLSAEDMTTDENGAQTVLCSVCALPLYWTHRFVGEEMYFVRVGTLEAGERFAPDAHYFVRSKHPWVSIPPGIAAYETLPNFSNE